MLGGGGIGRLACCRDEQPYVVPVFLHYDDETQCLYGFATVGQKIDWMRANPKVCIEVDHVADQTNWTTVLAFGRYEEVQDSAGTRSYGGARSIYSTSGRIGGCLRLRSESVAGSTTRRCSTASSSTE